MKPIRFILIILFSALSIIAEEKLPYDYEHPAGDFSNDNSNASQQFTD